MPTDRPSIIVLDGKTLNPGDLSWEPLRALGTVTVYDRTPAHLILERAAKAPILLTNKTPLSAETLARLPNLRYVGVLATGYNVVDVKAAARRSVVVTNVPSYGTDSVAQLVFALLLELCRHAAQHSTSVRDGAWCASPDFCYWSMPQVELTGKTLGVIGFGRIGSTVARVGKVFGMEALAHDCVPLPPTHADTVRSVALEQLLQSADVISLHCPLTPATEKLIRAETLALMKPTALLINTARGKLIDEPALAAALHAGTIAGAGLDVLSSEPPAPDNPLLSAPNCIITPHIAWATAEARARLLDTAVANVRAFLAGTPTNAIA